MKILRVVGVVVILAVACIAPGLFEGGAALASSDDAVDDFIVIANAHYDYVTTSFKNLTYEDANAFYDEMKAHGWTCIDYKAQDTQARTPEVDWYLAHSTSAAAHNPNASGTRPEAVSEEVYGNDFYGDSADQADSADIFYFMGHGWNSASGHYGVLGLHKYNVTSTEDNQFFTPQHVGNAWSKDLEWGVLAACSALKYDSSNKTGSGAYYYANAMDDGVHGFYGYKGTAPSWSGDEAIVDEFLLRAFGIRNIEPAVTLKDAWIGSNEWDGRGANWAILLHSGNEDDYLPRNWGGGGPGSDSTSRTDIYYWDAAQIDGVIVPSSAAGTSDENDRSVRFKRRGPVRQLAGGEWVYSASLEDRPTTMAPATAVAIGRACLREICPVATAEGALHSVREIRRIGLTNDKQETMGYIINFAQYVDGLRVAGGNGAMIWVRDSGVTYARVVWFDGQAPAVQGIQVDAKQAADVALGVIDLCQGPPVQISQDMVYYREGGAPDLTRAWEIRYDDGQRVYVDVQSGEVLP